MYVCVHNMQRELGKNQITNRYKKTRQTKHKYKHSKRGITNNSLHLTLGDVLKHDILYYKYLYVSN